MPQSHISPNPRDPQTPVAPLIASFQSQRPMRAGSLLITVFGDAIAPHGGTVWLGSLIRAMAPFGVNDRLVRTSIYRLAQDGWFSSHQVGRRSYYSLTELGRRRFHEASQHIYAEPRRQWSGDWCCVLLNAVAAEHRDGLRRELQWLGFAPVSPNLMAHPAPDRATLGENLQGIAGADRIIVTTTRVMSDSETVFNELVTNGWNLDELELRYQHFLQMFRPVYRWVRDDAASDEQAFQVRILLLHEYRKIILRDPFLPEALLPSDWSGTAAYQLCRNLYRAVAEPSERFITSAMETAEGPLPPAEPGFFDRFGGTK
ncbi:MAG: phenylacetic acid degradation operon negative regulatory protein PaaX [Gammaproteobacteria bacterium]|nr:phenylacetic acid degradation operon negative regulatory protein PaaX [Gammaproteobacteria bacterium]NND61157.1 phenylacetic acid degradation operon negative regulatory protein PaaX [Gammaproteobacteria bacterium]